jgi:hypothetical protein
MLAIGGQSPTLKNPPFVGTHPTWNIPSIFSVAQAAGVSWAAFPDGSGYPTKFYASLTDPAAVGNIHPPSQFIPMAKAGELPQVCYVWSPGGFDEHPPATNDPGYVSKGHDLVWQRVQAVIDGGGWPDTTFILTGTTGAATPTRSASPAIETAVDALHPGGFQVIGGSRIPLLMFGGKVAQGHRPGLALARLHPENDHRPARAAWPGGSTRTPPARCPRPTAPSSPNPHPPHRPVGAENLVQGHAASVYSWMSPVRSCRRTRRASRSMTGAGLASRGAAWLRARCVRCSL